VAHDDWTHFVVFGPCKIFCFLNRSLQNILFFKQVPAKNFVSENSPWRNYFKKQKILQEPKTKYFFSRNKNLNGPYLQGRVQYLSLVSNIKENSINLMK